MPNENRTNYEAATRYLINRAALRITERHAQSLTELEAVSADLRTVHEANVTELTAKLSHLWTDAERVKPETVTTTRRVYTINERAGDSYTIRKPAERRNGKRYAFTVHTHKIDRVGVRVVKTRKVTPAERGNFKHLRALGNQQQDARGSLGSAARFFAYVYTSLTSTEARATQSTTFPRSYEHNAPINTERALERYKAECTARGTATPNAWKRPATNYNLSSNRLRLTSEVAENIEQLNDAEYRSERGLARNVSMYSDDNGARDLIKYSDAEVYDGANAERAAYRARKRGAEFQPVTVKREVFTQAEANAWSGNVD